MLWSRAASSGQESKRVALTADQNALRRRIRIGAVCLLAMNIAVAVFARQQQRDIIDRAINVYDTAFVSTNYIHLAQIAFQHYLDQRLAAATPEDRAKADEGLGAVLEYLDVAIERADSGRSRELARQARATIAALADSAADSAALKDHLAGIQQQLESLVSHASAVGLDARDNIEGLSAKSDSLLIFSTGSIIVAVIVALLLLERLIAQAQAARRQAALRDTEIASSAREQGEQRERELAAKSVQADRMRELLDCFMREMAEPTKKLQLAAKDLNTNAVNLSIMAEQSKAESVTVAAASGETAAMVKSAATVGEQLAQTISEVQVNAVESSRLAAGAVSEVAETTATIDELADVAREIGEVTALISRVAEQTNLLALNATIEAARAGDAGRGFAVVAQEVKTLAGQTAKATQDISKRIGAIQNVAQRSVAAIQAISATIRNLEGNSVQIASAVEQQTQAAHAIAGNLAAASGRVVDVDGAIVRVESVGNRTAEAAAVLNAASVSVKDHAEIIHARVRAFTDDIRAIQAQSVA